MENGKEREFVHKRTKASSDAFVFLVLLQLYSGETF